MLFILYHQDLQVKQKQINMVNNLSIVLVCFTNLHIKQHSVLYVRFLTLPSDISFFNEARSWVGKADYFSCKQKHTSELFLGLWTMTIACTTELEIILKYLVLIIIIIIIIIIIMFLYVRF